MSHSENKQKRTTTNNTVSANSAFDGEQNFQLVSSDNNEILFSDHGAIEEAFDGFDRALDTVDESVRGSLSSTRSIIGDQVDAIKELATQLKVGDIEGSKFIAFAIIGAVLVAVLAYFAFSIWGK